MPTRTPTKSLPLAKHPRPSLTLLDDHGYATAYTVCTSPDAHHIVTYYRSDVSAYVCDYCNSLDFLKVNVWRYPPQRRTAIQTLLGIPITPTMPLVSPPECILAPEITEGSDCTTDPLNASECVVARCVCGVSDVSYVGMDGEGLCEGCWEKMMEIMQGA